MKVFKDLKFINYLFAAVTGVCVTAEKLHVQTPVNPSAAMCVMLRCVQYRYFH